MNKLIKKIATLSVGLVMAIGVGVAVGENGAIIARASEGDELAILQGTGSNYATRKTTTDSHGVGWVLRTGQSGYLGVNSADNHSNVKPTTDDLPVVKGVVSDATTNSTGIYYYFTTTAVSNVGSLTFSCTAHNNANNAKPLGYVVSSATAASSGSATWSQVSLASGSGYTSQGGSISGTDTYTFKFASTQTSARYYGFVVTVSAYDRWTSGTIKLLEGSSGGTVIDIERAISGPSDMPKTTDDSSFDISSEIEIEDEDPATGYSVGTSDSSVVSVSGTTLTPEATGTATITISKPSSSTTVGTVTTNISYTSHTFDVTVTAPEGENEIDYSKRYSVDTEIKNVKISKTNFSVTFGGSGTAPKYYASGSAVRAYQGNTITIEASAGQLIKEVVFTITRGSLSGTFSPSGTYSSGTWSTTTGVSQVVYTHPSTSGTEQVRISKITVTTEAIALSSISLGGTYQTAFNINDTFNHTGMTVTAHYSDSSTEDVTSSATWSSPDMSTSGTKQVTVSYTKNGTTKTANYNITIATYYTVTNSVSNATFSTDSILENNPLSVTITPDTHYGLPTSLTSVTMGGNTLVAGTDYTYNSSTGAFNIASVTGNVVITGACVEDAKYTITYVHGSHGTGSNYVVNNQYAGSYTLTTFATAGFTASEGYAFVKWSVGGVEYAEGATINISGNTTVTAIYVEASTYTIVTDTSTLVDGTTFVLVAYFSATSTYYVSNGLNGNHALLTEKTTATTISNGVESGSTLVSTEAQAFTLEGSTGSFKIKYGDSYLKFSGSGNGDDSFDTEANASTFSVTMSGSYIWFTCTSSTGNGRVWRMNTSSKDMRNYASNSGVTDVYMFANIPAQNKLDSVTTSGQTTSFTAGNKWSYGGTLTAHYTIDDDATVTPTSFKVGASGIDPTSAGTTISTSTTLTVDAHNGKYIYVVYTEDNITKWASYQITINYAPVTSVEISIHSAEIGFNEVFNHTSVTVTINSEYAQQGYEWIVTGNTVNYDYDFDNSGLLAGDTEGTITLRCRSTADNSKYDELVVTVTGDPTASFTPSSVSGYVGKGTSVAFTYGNIDDTSKIAVASSSASVSVGAISASNDNGTVAITFVSAGTATLSISYDGGSTLDTVTVTVNNDSVVALNWTASNIKVYSGAVLPVAIEDTWMVNYEMASGDADYITYSDGDYTVLLDDEEISLPHTWSADDDGKQLSVEYMGFESSTVSVDVTQTLRAVNAPISSDNECTLTSSTISSNTQDSASIGGKTWYIDYDWNSSAPTTKTQFDTTKGQQFGTAKNSLDSLEFSTSGFSGTITAVTVNTSGASNIDCTISVSVGGKTFFCGGSSSVAISNTATNYTFEGSGSGEIVVTWTNSSAKAIYLNGFVVSVQTDISNIANVAGHEAAQKAVVKFAKEMNAAFDNTENCTTGVAAAWSTASDAYDDFLDDISGLSSDEQAYAKNLIKYATAQYTYDTDDDFSYCLERAMATYERCVTLHGQDPFMSEVRPVSSGRITPYASILSKNANAAAVVIIVSVISVAAIGGYFFLRKKKED